MWRPCSRALWGWKGRKVAFGICSEDACSMLQFQGKGSFFVMIVMHGFQRLVTCRKEHLWNNGRDVNPVMRQVNTV